MACGSRAPDLPGQIWCVLWLLLVAGVHCGAPSSDEELGASISVNKAVPSSYSTLLPWRGTGWSMWSFLDLLLRWEDDEELCRSSSCNKRCYLLHCDLQVSCFLLAGLGGEGEKVESLVAAGGGRWRGEFLESVLPVAVPQRWHLLAAAILGQEAGLAILGSNCCLRFIFLHRRIFLHLGASSHTHALPSGRVPGGSRSGRGWRWFIVGELGSDRVFCDLFMVFCAKVLDFGVIFPFRKVLSVTVHPPTK
jgi:hypothetical protein